MQHNTQRQQAPSTQQPQAASVRQQGCNSLLLNKHQSQALQLRHNSCSPSKGLQVAYRHMLCIAAAAGLIQPAHRFNPQLCPAV